MNQRSPGRYNLHRLGWMAFEDLCMQIMRVVLGETCTRFLVGPDGGRDGWFEGTPTKLLATQNGLRGKFVVQCKHTSRPHEPLDKTHLGKELSKVKRLAEAGSLNYVLMTNRQVSAQSEAAIRSEFLGIPGVDGVLVISESWIEDTIDAHPRLLRLVPRLYGIGDLTQIVSFGIQQQTTAVLEDLAVPLRTFVPTDSYRRAEKALHEHGFVVLVGPPASGKSSIAANLCMVNLAQNSDARILRIEHADQFKNSWSPGDAHTFYWVDDVFGETTLDETRVREWSAALDKIEAARRRKARIIFCTRDYILTAAETKLKRTKADFINDARVRVEVTRLSADERDSILYNHVKEGDIEKKQKTALKKHLSALARLSSFSPEIARRLASKRFHSKISYEFAELKSFFSHPVEHFRDVIKGLSQSEKSALAVCLLSGNAVPDPVPKDAVIEPVLESYGVSIYQVREALENLEGSLVKRVRQATSQTWQLHHPSMIEALQAELSERTTQLSLYLQGAKVDVVLRDTTTVASAIDARLIFIPETLYGPLLERLCKAGTKTSEGVARYLAFRASHAFLIGLDRREPGVLDGALRIESEPDGDEISCHLAVALSEVGDGALLDRRRREILMESIQASFDETGWTGFLGIEGLEKVLGDEVRALIQEDLRTAMRFANDLYAWCSQDLSSLDHVKSAQEILAGQAKHLKEEAARWGLSVDTMRVDRQFGRFEQKFEERIAELEEQAELRADYDDDWKERWREERFEIENGRFSDVDE